MRLHRNAALSLKGRELLVDRVLCQSWQLVEAAQAAGVSERTGAKWLARYRAEGSEGLVDPSSAPKRCPSRVPDRVQAPSLRPTRFLLWRWLRYLLSQSPWAPCTGRSAVPGDLQARTRIPRPALQV
jgi:hypothetical protein